MKKQIHLLAISLFLLSTLPDLGEAGTYSKLVTDLAARSSCSRYSWKNRGRAPAGYTKGMALTFARSLCRIKASGATPPPAKGILSSPNSKNPNIDALAYYQKVFASLGVEINVAGKEPLRGVYSLGIGLGMRETAGAYCEGYDVSAGTHRSSAAAEAGLFQASYDSMRASAELSKLYKEYQASPQRCLRDVFKEGVKCKARGILGTGAGATYQAFNKSCPAFATEYAMTMLRVRRNHFGPINRKEAEVVPACETLLDNVQSLVDSNPNTICREIF